MLNSRFDYSMKKNSFMGLNIDCIQYSNIIRITYYSYSGTILNPNIIRIRIRSKFGFRIKFVFGPKNSIRSPLVWLISVHHVFSVFSGCILPQCGGQTEQGKWRENHGV